MLGLLLALVVLHLGFYWMLEYGSPGWRDPEFGKRFEVLRNRIATQPGAKPVIVLGSSRVAMGLRPDAIYGEPKAGELRGPMLLNMSLAGSGPIMELWVYRRLLAEGIRPAAVLIEYWPAFLREDGSYHEDSRIDPLRLNQADRWMVESYFRPEHQVNVAENRRKRSLQPWLHHRKSLMNRFAAAWLPYSQRSEAIWDKIDHWGWLPGRENASAEEAAQAINAAGGYYKPLFDNYTVSPVADRALRELIGEIRSSNIPLALLYLPESSGFVGFVPKSAQFEADHHLEKLLRAESMNIIDARGWVDDAMLPDGFHLTKPGAAEVTRRLQTAVERLFPQLRSQTP